MDLSFQPQSPRRRCLGRWRIPLLLSVLVFCIAVSAQTSASQTRKTAIKPAQPYPKTSPADAVSELQKRIAATQVARDSGDPQAIAAASRSLIALALREVAHLRLQEDAAPAAIDLYRRSLDFENSPGTQVDLAIAYLRAKKTSDALSEAGKAISANPDDARAWHAQGIAYMASRRYDLAADSLRHCLALREDHEAEYSLAIALLSLHKKTEAAAVFRKMEAGASNRGTLHVLMARAYRDAGYLDDAVNELKAALRIDPQTPHAHYLLGLVYLLQEEWAPTPEIRAQFLQELKLNPHDFLSNYLMGAVESNGKNFDESNRYLSLATQIDGSWPEPWIYLGLNANNQGRKHEAEDDFRRAIALTGEDDARSNYLIRKAYFALGRILSESDRKDEAAKDLQKAREIEERVQVESQKNSPVNRPAMGGEEIGVPEDDAGQQQEKTGADSLHSHDPAAQLDTAALAHSQLTAGEKEQALDQEKKLRTLLGASFNDLATSEALREEYSPAVEHYKEAEGWESDLLGLRRNLGVTAFHAQNYSEAVNALAPALTTEPENKAIRSMLGMSYYLTEQYSEASRTIAPLGDAALADPGLAYAWADSLARQNQLEESSHVLEKLAIQTLPSDTMMLVGQLWEQIGNHQQAIDTYHHVLEREPSRKKVHYYAGLAYIRAGQPADAEREFRAELLLTPDDADADYHLGFTLLQLSQRDRAADVFREVIAAHPEHSEAQYQLGKILEDEGKLTDAVPHLEAAARLDPEADYVHYQLQAAYRELSRTQDADRELALYKELKEKHRSATIPRPNSQ